MGIGIEAGRGFGEDDRVGTGGVVIINEALAARYLAGKNPLESSLVMSGWGPSREQPNATVPIVGVVSDVKYVSLSDAAEPALYAIGRFMNRQSIVVATNAANPSNLVPLIRTELQQLDPLVPIEVSFLPQVVSESLSRQRLGMLLMVLFGTVAVLLAAIGVYGVFAYATSQRRREVAIRLAIGATPAEAFRLTFVRGQLIAVVGVLCGVVLAYGAGRLLTGSLYQIRAADPLVLIASTAIVAAVAALATALPAGRAARVDPGVTLRDE